VAIWAALATGRALHISGPWLVLTATAVTIYLSLRFCLVGPISFAEKRIDFLRSWRLTGGRAAALLGMTMLSLCLIALLMVVVLLVLAVIAAGSAGLDGVAGMFGGADALRRHPGLYALEAAVEIVLTPVLWVLGATPLAAAYRSLSAASPPA
jgi:hypothetical protein